MKFIINNTQKEVIDSPSTPGTEGQVLTIDANGNPKWDNTSDMSNYYNKSEIDSLISSLSSRVQQLEGQS